jgi:uncharacterized protein (DUF362 family)
MDGKTAYVKGGPAMGTEVNPHLFLAGSDRIAMDAVGVALLRQYGTTHDVAKNSIFEQAQLRRAGELGLGATSLRDIRLNPLDEYSETICEDIVSQFAK